MVGIDPMISCHYLNINSSYVPHRQKRLSLNPERYEALKDEVGKLSRSGFIREAIYPNWISNPALVKKPSGKWRMCVDFTNLNKTEDYCYKVMPFRLKNVGSTYQRLVNMMFAELISKTMKIYVDGMLVKSLQFLGYIVNQSGIEVNPVKITVLPEMRATDKSLPFFKVLKQGKRFQWTSECEEAFHALKKHLGEASLYSKPQPEESLLLSLAVSDVVVSVVLVREENER
ncbi:uncharacterized protein LOC111379983 [Olea europaea var. sylvestris]|uniref:uncharacterized protein LOC111379983 n=1 Tax=Olea europaea var. sylvestris TaxID=158386 RepID=UPI000C1D5B43|nr:uncharacterized protein LOC111379983 [Olea europaea var. sylvestris]